MEKQNGLKAKIKDILGKKSVRYSFAAIVMTGLGTLGYFVGRPVAIEVKDSAAVKSIKEKGVARTYADAVFSIINKLSELEKLDRTNAELHKKLATLEKDYEAEKSKNVQEEAKEVTEVLSEKLVGETGSELARVLQSIEYQPPSHLLPHQQYTLALGYFRKQEYEQAAVLFTYLTELKEDTSYQRPEVYLMSAISWFKLKHFKLSSEYVKKTLKKSEEDTSVHRKAILWQALLAQAQGGKAESQRVLTSLVARYPHSEEVTWVNGRGPASAERELHSAVKKNLEKHDEEQNNHHKKDAKKHQDEHAEEHPDEQHDEKKTEEVKRSPSEHKEEKHDDHQEHSEHE